MRRASRPLKQKFDSVLSRATSRILKDYPRTLAIIVSGSAGRGEPGVYSDVDILAVSQRGHHPESFAYFDQEILVGIGFITLNRFKSWSSDLKEFYWARGEALSARVLHDPSGIVGRILRTRRIMKTPNWIVEDTVWDAYYNILEYVGKLRNGWSAKDEYLTRYAARVVAQYSEKTMVALNDLSPISENRVWHQVLQAKQIPAHFKTDYPTAMGIKGTKRTRTVYHAGLRLGRETLGLIRDEFESGARRKAFRRLIEQTPGSKLGDEIHP